VRVSDVQALILAAGKGTRMKSERAKVLHEALGLPLLEHVLRAVRATGAAPITVVVGHQAAAIKRGFEPAGVEFALQEPQLGTGHAVQVARAQITRHRDRPVLVVHGDVPLVRPAALTALIDSYGEGGAAATLLCCESAEPGHYGRVVRNALGDVQAIVEFKDATAAERAIREINAGIYLFDVDALCSVLDHLVSANAQGEYYLTDVVGLLAQSGLTVRACVAAQVEDVLGVNTLAELAAAADILRQRRLKALLTAGVVIEDPATTWIGCDVQLEADAVVRPNTIIEGRSVVRRQASVGPFVRVINCDIGPHARILDHCLLRDSTVGAHATIGPLAHLRSESVVDEMTQVGAGHRRHEKA
jgi:bifunctional UDP-N-acetylglucosamine pyrophosphorylase / glucosamine-1-phosphate N-acetyltransferase